MFGRNGYLESVKTALAAAGADMTVFRGWQKQYEKLGKRKKEEEERYRRCRELTIRVREDAQLLEQLLTSGDEPDVREVGRLLKDLKQMQGAFFHEFLICRDDQEVSSTYDTIVRMGTKAIAAADQRLLLQSEVENLLELVKENLEKEAPRPEELAYYYQLGGESGLEKLPPAERMARVRRTFENGFYRPIMQILEEGIAGAKRCSEELSDTDRSGRRRREALLPLLEQDAEHIYERLMTE